MGNPEKNGCSLVVLDILLIDISRCLAFVEYDGFDPRFIAGFRKESRNYTRNLKTAGFNILERFHGGASIEQGDSDVSILGS